MPSGTVVPLLRVPQVSFAQNPWCLVAGLPRTAVGRGKAAAQRLAYRRAMHETALMIFNSEYMRRAYRENAGFAERRSLVVYQAINDETHAAAERVRQEGVPRQPCRIVSVSAMAPHKNVETLLAAVARVAVHAPEVELALVGAWPDAAYRRRMERLAADLGIAQRIQWTGHVEPTDLHRLYAQARVFCLMSRCESFGIPAVEAQAFGTPVVSSDCCAIPEVCGGGGVFVPPTEIEQTAAALLRLLTDDAAWAGFSVLAVRNAARFRWEICSPPLLGMFDQVGDA